MKRTIMIIAALTLASPVVAHADDKKAAPARKKAAKKAKKKGAKKEAKKEAAKKEHSSQSGLKWTVLKEGKGERPKRGDRVVVHYTGWLTNGKKFDSSRDRGSKFKFKVGVGQVIKGWDEGVMRMRPGDRFKFTIPAKLAYGERGIGPIPPNSTLIFDVEFFKVAK